jgi:hypothetical protein
LRRKNGEKKNLVGRSNVTVMASVAFPGMKEEYETLRLSPGATEKDVKSAFRRLALHVYGSAHLKLYPLLFNKKKSMSEAKKHAAGHR